MGTDIPRQVFVAAFTSETGADQALQSLQQARKENLIDIEQAVVVRKDAAGKVYVKRARGVGAGSGAIIGGVTGAVVSLLAGPVGWVAGAGAIIGALGGHYRKTRRTPQVDQLAGALTPGTSAIVAVVDHVWVADLEREMAAQGAKVVTEAIATDIATQLEAGKDVAYTAVSAGDTLAVARQTTETVPAEVLVANPDGGDAAPAPAADKA
jgi:uncharacterized membrane protein